MLRLEQLKDYQSTDCVNIIKTVQKLSLTSSINRNVRSLTSNVHLNTIQLLQVKQKQTETKNELIEAREKLKNVSYMDNSNELLQIFTNVTDISMQLALIDVEIKLLE
ncbi:unnamed protein product, partial [Adineta steineri]